MTQTIVGVNVDDFRLAPKDALRRAADLAFRSIALATVEGDLAPANLGRSGRRHLARLVDGLGLRLDSLVADMPALRFTDPHTVQERVERTCQIIELAADMRVPTVTSTLGMVAHPDTNELSPNAIEALRTIGEFADSRDTRFAVSPSRDAGERLVSLLEEIACDAVRVSFDPAAIVMRGTNPLAAIERFIGEVVVVQARDGTAGGRDHPGNEARLGEGDVDWYSVVAAMQASDFRGPYVLRSADSANPVADVHQARKYLEKAF